METLFLDIISPRGTPLARYTMRELCFKVINAPGGSAEFQSIGSSLQTAISRHIDHLRSRALWLPR
jgi:hypothetical protein